MDFVNDVYTSLNESVKVLSKIDVEKLPIEEQFNLALCLKQYTEASKKFDEEIRELVVRAAALGALKD